MLSSEDELPEFELLFGREIAANVSSAKKIKIVKFTIVNNVLKFLITFSLILLKILVI